MGKDTLTLPRKAQEEPERLRFIERKDRLKQRPRLILQELVEDGRWRDVPLVREA